ncbi:MAG: O-antigen ligase family protein, partial [Vicinamibacteraceae bacterium]
PWREPRGFASTMTTVALSRSRTAVPSLASQPAESSFAQKLAFKLYLLFMVSWFLHLPARAEVLGQLRLDLLLVLAIAGAIFATARGSIERLDSRINRLLIALFAYAIVTLPFVEWPGSVLKHGIPELIKAVVFYYFTALLVTSEQKLKRVLFVFTVCQALRVLEPVYLHVTQGYWGSAASMDGGTEFMSRLSGAPSDVVNPNGLAAVIVTVIPFVHYLWTQRPSGRIAYVGLMPVLLYALMLTGSRSGMVALAATFMLIWLQSHRKALLTLAGVVVVMFSIPRLSEDLQDRYLSIVNPNTRNYYTADQRVEGIKDDFRVAMRRPFFGHGLGTSREANGNFGTHYQPSHNLFTEVAQELGFVGMPLFGALLVAIGISVRRALRTLKTSPSANPLLVRLCCALQVWFVVNILSAVFTYGLSSNEWYFMAGFANVITLMLSTSAEPHASEPERSRGPSAPTRVNPVVSPRLARRARQASSARPPRTAAPGPRS